MVVVILHYLPAVEGLGHLEPAVGVAPGGALPRTVGRNTTLALIVASTIGGGRFAAAEPSTDPHRGSAVADLSATASNRRRFGGRLRYLEGIGLTAASADDGFAPRIYHGRSCVDSA